jgi:hypothetical protein
LEKKREIAVSGAKENEIHFRIQNISHRNTALVLKLKELKFKVTS